jgi:hypothetical protein
LSRFNASLSGSESAQDEAPEHGFGFGSGSRSKRESSGIGFGTFGRRKEDRGKDGLGDGVRDAKGKANREKRGVSGILTTELEDLYSRFLNDEFSLDI